MIWTTQQVQAMESYVFQQAVDMYLVELAVDKDAHKEFLAARLFRALQEAGHTWGLEIHRDDMRTDIVPNEGGHMMDIVRMTWRPATRDGVLIGGPEGGRVFHMGQGQHRRYVDVAHVHHDTPTFAVPSGAEFGPDDAYTAPVERWRYEWAGWSETRRMWAYRGHKEA